MSWLMRWNIIEAVSTDNYTDNNTILANSEHLFSIQLNDAQLRFSAKAMNDYLNILLSSFDSYMQNPRYLSSPTYPDWGKNT